MRRLLLPKLGQISNLAYGSRPTCRKHQHPTTNLKKGTDNLHPCSLHELDYSVRAGKGSKRTAKNERQVDISFFLRSTALSSRTSPLLRFGYILEVLSKTKLVNLVRTLASGRGIFVATVEVRRASPHKSLRSCLLVSRSSFKFCSGPCSASHLLVPSTDQSIPLAQSVQNSMYFRTPLFRCYKLVPNLDAVQRLFMASTSWGTCQPRPVRPKRRPRIGSTTEQNGQSGQLGRNYERFFRARTYPFVYRSQTRCQHKEKSMTSLANISNQDDGSCTSRKRPWTY
jgi:hypothetical protein